MISVVLADTTVVDFVVVLQVLHPAERGEGTRHLWAGGLQHVGG